jgi:hypothetical protein
LDESALDESSVTPVPRQSSWVINRPPGVDCACTIPYHVAL